MGVLAEPQGQGRVVERGGEGRSDSPWTAMLFRSCRMTFPADTCTVTVLTPSREKVQATLPSRVMMGCWGSRTDEGGRGRGGGEETESGGVGGLLARDPHHATVIYMYVSKVLRTH